MKILFPLLKLFSPTFKRSFFTSTACWNLLSPWVSSLCVHIFRKWKLWGLGEVLNYLNGSHIEVTKVSKHCLSSCFIKKCNGHYKNFFFIRDSGNIASNFSCKILRWSCRDQRCIYCTVMPWTLGEKVPVMHKITPPREIQPCFPFLLK